MRIRSLLPVRLLVVLLGTFTIASAQVHIATQSFTTAGSDTFTVPSGTGFVVIKAWGAGGWGTGNPEEGYSDGGAGGFVTAHYLIAPSTVIQIRVGNAGGSASAAFVAGSFQVIAGGGGTAGNDSNGSGQPGGAAGPTGQSSEGGAGATQTGPGSGVEGAGSGPMNLSGGGSFVHNGGFYGKGGAGYYGGGAGAGGGGGSNYYDPANGYIADTASSLGGDYAYPAATDDPHYPGNNVARGGHEGEFPVPTGSGAVVIIAYSSQTVLPSFTSNPVNKIVVTGSSTTYTAAATGFPTATLQWQRMPPGGSWTNLADSGSYSGVTTGTLAVSNVTSGMNGDQFRCVATNSVGSIASAAGTLLLATVPTITSHPQPQTANAAQSVQPVSFTFSVIATGTPSPSYQWQRLTNGGTWWADLTNGQGYSGVTTATLTFFGSISIFDSTQFRCRVANSEGTVTSNSAALTVTSGPAFITHPQSATVTAPMPATFTVSVTGSPSPTYQWQRTTDWLNWHNIAPSVDFVGVNSHQLSVSGTYNPLMVNGNGFRCVITNSMGSAVSSQAVLTILGMFGFSQHPKSQTVAPGGSVTFTATAVGTPTPSWYEWQRFFNGGWHDIGAYGSSLTVNGVTQAMDGYQYRCFASNGTNSAYSNAATLVIDPNTVSTAPTITTHPQSRSLVLGGSTTFVVEATGSPAPNYQWLKDGAAISGATSFTYTIANAQQTHAGAYSVLVSNTAGSVTSSPATVMVSNSLPAVVMIRDITWNSFRVTWIDPGTNVAARQVAVNDLWDSPLSAEITGVTKTGLTPNTTYQVRVRALGSGGNIVREAKLRVTTPDQPSSAEPPPTPAFVPDVPSRWLDVPRWESNGPNVTRIDPDGILDEIIPAGNQSWKAEAYVTGIWWEVESTGATGIYNVAWGVDSGFPWSNYSGSPSDFSNSRRQYEGDVAPDPLPTGPDISGPFFIGEIRFNAEAGYDYDFYYMGPGQENLPATWGRGFPETITGNGPKRLDIGEIQPGLQYGIVRYGFAPSGCVLTLPSIGNVVVSGGAAGAGLGIVLPGGIKVVPGAGSSSTASINIPGSATITINEEGQVTGTLPNGVTVVRDASGQATLVLPSGLRVNTRNGEVSVSAPNGISIIKGPGVAKVIVPEGLSTAVANAVDHLGKLLGLGTNPTNVRAKVDNGTWGGIGSLSTVGTGEHTVRVTTDEREEPREANILTISIIIVPRVKIDQMWEKNAVVNRVPNVKQRSPNRLIVATETSGKAEIIVKATITPQSEYNRVLCRMNDANGTVVTQRFAANGEVQIDVAPATSFAGFSVSVGYDLNNDSVLSEGEVIREGPTYDSVVLTETYVQYCRNDLGNNATMSGPALPVASSILRHFLNRTDIPEPFDATSVKPINCFTYGSLTHNAGAAFTSSGDAVLMEGFWNGNSVAGARIANSAELKAIIDQNLTAGTAAILAFFAQNPTQTSFTTTWNLTSVPINYLTTNPFDPPATDLHFAFGGANLPTLSVTVTVTRPTGGTPSITRLVAAGSLVDLTDFNYENGGLPAQAAAVQIGFDSSMPTRDAGRLFFNRTEFNRTWEPYAFTLQ